MKSSQENPPTMTEFLANSVKSFLNILEIRPPEPRKMQTGRIVTREKRNEK